MITYYVVDDWTDKILFECDDETEAGNMSVFFDEVCHVTTSKPQSI